MKPDLIKFVTGDNCVAYEQVHGVEALGSYIRRAVKNEKLRAALMPDAPFEMRCRTYALYDRYVDQETGKFIYEYREVYD